MDTKVFYQEIYKWLSSVHLITEVIPFKCSGFPLPSIVYCVMWPVCYIIVGVVKCCFHPAVCHHLPIVTQVIDLGIVLM